MSVEGSVEARARACLMASFDGPVVPSWLLDEIAAGLGGVCLFAGNIDSDDQVRRVVATMRDARADVVMAIDEEGGDVTRLDATTGSMIPGPGALGAVDDVGATEAAYRLIGRRLTALGVDLDLAPCADVNVTVANPVIGVRSFGADPDLVARHVAAAVAGLQSVGVAACVKHYPGHGATADDSHRALPTLDVDDATLRRRELVPFAAAVAAGAASVMTAHIVVPSFDTAPATRSATLLGLLRRDLGFDGVIVSDALDMAGVHGANVGSHDVRPEMIGAAAVSSLSAGCDVLCLGARQSADVPAAAVAAIVAAVANGDLSAERLIDSQRRIAALHPIGSLNVPGAADDEGRVAPIAERAMAVMWRPVATLTGALIVDCRPGISMANHDVAWGLGEDIAALDGTAAAMDATDRTQPEEILARAGDRPLVVTVRGAAAHRWQRDLLRQLASRRPDLVSVELGWPDPDHPATITTFGASRDATRAVARLLTGQSPAHSSRADRRWMRGRPA